MHIFVLAIPPQAEHRVSNSITGLSVVVELLSKWIGSPSWNSSSFSASGYVLGLTVLHLYLRVVQALFEDVAPLYG